MLPNVVRNDQESDLVRLAKEYKVGLSAQLDGHMSQMADQWMKVKNEFDITIQEILKQMELREAMGLEVGPEWARSLSYHKKLRNQVIQEVQKYNRLQIDEIQRQQLIMIEGSTKFSQDMINIALKENLASEFFRLPTEQTEAIYRMMVEGSPLRKLFDDIGFEAANNATDIMTKSISMGKPIKEVATLMSEATNIAFSRANTIARTEIFRAHRLATQESYEASDVVDGYYRLANKGRACMACLLLDGEFFPKNVQFTDHPNGGCTMIPHVKGMPAPKWVKGKDYFQNLPEEEQKKRMGAKYFKAWKEKEFDLDQMAGYSHNAKWGSHPRIVPLKELAPDWIERNRVVSIPEIKMPIFKMSDAIDNVSINKLQSIKVKQVVEEGINRIDNVVKFDINEKQSKIIAEKLKIGEFPDHSIFGKNVGGQFYPGSKRIDINGKNIKGVTRESLDTVIHEIGHYLDYDILNKSGSAVFTKTKDGAEIINIIKNSKSYSRLQRIYASNKRILEYYTSEDELFARAFAQWVQIRNDPKLIKFYHEKSFSGVSWGEDDFGEIAAWFDKNLGGK